MINDRHSADDVNLQLNNFGGMNNINDDVREVDEVEDDGYSTDPDQF